MKKFFISFCITLMVLFSIVAVVSSSKTSKESITDNPTKFSSTYKIMNYNGKLAVYKNDSEVPVKIYNIFLENLPASDREEIKKGIICKDDAELRRLIEDYTS